MTLNGITMVDVGFAEETGCYEAEFCLVCAGPDGQLTHAYLRGRTVREADDHPDALARRLLDDLRRQMRWMPEFRDLRDRLEPETRLAA